MTPAQEFEKIWDVCVSVLSRLEKRITPTVPKHVYVVCEDEIKKHIVSSHDFYINYNDTEENTEVIQELRELLFYLKYKLRSRDYTIYCSYFEFAYKTKTKYKLTNGKKRYYAFTRLREAKKYHKKKYGGLQ